MPRRVEQVDDTPVVGELHHRRGNGNAALFFHRHPVGSSVASGFAPFDRARKLDCAPRITAPFRSWWFYPRRGGK